MKMNAPTLFSFYKAVRRVAEEPRGQFRYNSGLHLQIRKNTNLIYADKINKNKNKK